MFLAGLWHDVLRRADPQDQAADLELIIKSCEDSPERRLVVAEYDGEPAGAVLLCVSTLSPLNLEPTVSTIAPCVAPGFRRRGVGHVLMDAAVTYAEELGIGHVLTAAAYSSRVGQPVHGQAGARARRRCCAWRARRRSAASSPPSCPARCARWVPGRWARSSRRGAACAVPSRRTPQRPRARSLEAISGDQRAGDPRGADALAVLVGDHHLVARHRAAEVDRRWRRR